MRKIKLAEIPVEIIENSKRDGILICKRSNMYCVEFHGVIVGICGILFFNNKARFKSAYVVPEFRETGVYKKMIEERLKICEERGVFEIEAYCTKMSQPILINKGFVVCKSFKNTKLLKYEIVHNNR